MSEVVLDVNQWAEKQFGSCELGNSLRTRRAVKVAAQIASHPDGSTPRQMESWGDLKATYRLFDNESVTFKSLAEPHWKQTRARAKDVCLVLNDTTETDFGIGRKVTGLGPTGNGGGHGFLLHSALMVQAETREVLGLAGQEILYRKLKKRKKAKKAKVKKVRATKAKTKKAKTKKAKAKAKKESFYQRLKRPRESEVWGRVIDLVGPPAEGVRYIHVDDRGADNFEVFCHLGVQRCGWVVRASQLKRIVYTPDGLPVILEDWLAEQPVLGTYELKVRPTKTESARVAKLEVRAVPATLVPPKGKTPYIRQMGIIRIEEWIVEAREVNPPKGAKPVRWVLHTSESAETFEDAWQILEYYEARWLIEEFHKCLKTGCKLESRMYSKASRLEALTGMLSVVSVRLLQLKQIALRQPDLPAERAVPRLWLEMLRNLRSRPIKTVRDFVRHLAGLGGFLMRKGDGEPGWMTIWRGLDKLLLCLRGAHAARRKVG